MARTNLFPLVRECFLGFRGSYNWKFVPIIESGCRIRTMSAARANFTHSGHTKIGSFPRNKRISPYSGTADYVGNDGPGFASADSSAIIPIISSLPTLLSRPGPWWGELACQADERIDLSPNISPAHCGPQMAFPPLYATRVAPLFK